MEVTITEALRFKNEIAAMIRKLESSIRYPSQITFGTKTENGVVVSDSKSIPFNTALDNLSKMLNYSEEINNALANFNRTSGVDALVRKQNNLKLKYNVCEAIIPQTKPTKTKKFETVGNKREEIETEFIPSVNGSDIKKQMSAFKAEIRIVQAEIEKQNQGNITLSFSYEDVEALTLE